jgi:hypothetical protein
LKGLEELSGFGMTVKGITSRIAGIVAGGGIGGAIAFSGITSNVEGAIIAAVLLGIAGGYLAIEGGLWRYKVKKRPEIIEETKKRQEALWDKVFTIEAHVATLMLYRKSSQITEDIYCITRRTREKAREFAIIIQMFMQRPMLEEVSTFSQFIQSCSEIENKMREYISDSPELGKEFWDEFGDDPWERGFKRLSKFLKERKKIDKELYEDILIIRNKRRRLFLDADYNKLTYYTDLARNVFKRLNKQIGEEIF